MVLRADTGGVIPVEVARWRRDPDDVEQALLATLRDPVIDIGCGPGRIVAALAGEGRMALGIDASPLAADEANRGGATVLCRSVFTPLPGEGRWGSAVLLDGAVGIGGDPVRLLRRVAELLRPAGHAVIEVSPPGSPTEAFRVRLDSGDEDRAGPWFPWARVGVNGFEQVALEADLVPVGFDVGAGRWFARAVKP